MAHYNMPYAMLLRWHMTWHLCGMRDHNLSREHTSHIRHKECVFLMKEYALQMCSFHKGTYRFLNGNLHFWEHKWMQNKCKKWCNWFWTFCIRKPWLIICKYMSIRSIWWENKSYENFKVLKFWNKLLQGKWFFY
jgi:hypothetical protein